MHNVTRRINDESNKYLNLVNDGLYVSLINEGKYLGHTAIHIVLSGCNLRCCWRLPDGNGSLCDRFNSSFKPDDNLIHYKEISKKAVAWSKEGINKIVITGGEPMLQILPLLHLLDRLTVYQNIDFYIILETNGTIFDIEIAKRINFVSISPKLKSAAPWVENVRNTEVEFNDIVLRKHEYFRKNTVVIKAWIKNSDYELKFIVTKESDIYEIEDQYLYIIKRYDSIYHIKYDPSKVVLIPVGQNADEIKQVHDIVLKLALQKKLWYAPRLHIY